MGNYAGCCTERSFRGLFFKSSSNARDADCVGDEAKSLSLESSNGKQYSSSNSKTIMSKYKMGLGASDKLGEGSFTLVRRAEDIESGDMVAVKIYKQTDKSTLRQIKRLVSVLKELQLPFGDDVPKDLWHEHLGKVQKSKLFMWLVDFSKTSDHEPGPDPRDHVNYVVTEMAQFSLLDYIKECKKKRQPMSPDTFKALARAVIVATAALHARGFVHLDLKPENYMVFNGSMKVIDVDGCVRLGHQISIDDSSLSFSPCYCAPEWARFLIGEEDVRYIKAESILDVWSVGLTIMEMIHMDAVLKAKYGSFLRMGRSSQDAGFLFMEWLSTIPKLPLPKSMEGYDPEIIDLLTNYLLAPSEKRRRTLAQSLTHKTMKIDDARVNCPLEDLFHRESDEAKKMAQNANPNNRFRSQQQTGSPLRVVHRSTLWKLMRHGTTTELAQWHKHDTWISENGSLYYFSLKKNAKTLLLDGHHLAKAILGKYTGSLPADKNMGPNWNFVFQIKAEFEQEGDMDVALFACETESEYQRWVEVLAQMMTPHAMSMRLGPKMAKDLQEFKLMRRNRRIKVDDDGTGHRFEGSLWKLKVDGSAMNEKDWFQRDMWLARDGSLVYHSQREKADLVYYTAADILSAKIEPLKDVESCKAYTFKVQFPDVDGMEIPPGILAAASAKAREGWIAALKSLSAIR